MRDYECCNYCALNNTECPCHPSNEIKDFFVCDFHIPDYEKIVQEAKADERLKIIGWLFDNNMLQDYLGQNLKEYDLLEKEEIIATIIRIYEKE